MKNTKKPNILFILTDDQRYNTIHALGNKAIHTPNMDELVYCGTSFTQAHIPGGTSGAVCMPSRAMINTGRTLFHLQGEGQDIPVEHTTLGETLKKADYYCYGTGKWHNGPPAFTRSFDQGDNIFFGGMWDHWNVPTCYYDPTGEYDNEINFVADFWNDHNVIKQHCDKFNPGVHSSELLTDTAISFLDGYKGDKPFFLYTAYLAPHDPRTMPEKFKKMYNPEDIEVPVNFTEQHFEFGVSQIRDETLIPYPRTKAAVQKEIADYYAMITHLDFEIGRLISELKKIGQYENTIIILAGDNGLAIGNHGLMGKQNNYEHSIRVPLIIAGPGIPKGECRDQYVYLLDIYPTLCDILNIPVPESVEGKSFYPCIKDRSCKIRENLYFAYNNFIRSVKDDRYKLIRYRNCANRIQLFDLKDDPEEMCDLSERPEYQQTVEKMMKLMQQYSTAWDDRSHPMGADYWNQ